MSGRSVLAVLLLVGCTTWPPVMSSPVPGPAPIVEKSEPAPPPKPEPVKPARKSPPQPSAPVPPPAVPKPEPAPCPPADGTKQDLILQRLDCIREQIKEIKP